LQIPPGDHCVDITKSNLLTEERHISYIYSEVARRFQGHGHECYKYTIVWPIWYCYALVSGIPGRCT